MLKHKLSYERQINAALYQFLVPYEAPNWKEVLMVYDNIRPDLVAKAEEENKREAEPKASEEKKEG